MDAVPSSHMHVSRVQGVEIYHVIIKRKQPPVETLEDFNVSFRAPEWCSGLRYCISVLEASLQTLVRSRAVSQPVVIGNPIGQCTIGPASSGLGEVLPG
jgi:hypothetical protein